MPRVHLDWRLLYAPPEDGLRLWLFEKAVRFDLGFLVVRLLRLREDTARWVNTQAGVFFFEVVVPGRPVLQDALQSLVSRDRPWVGSIVRTQSWAGYCSTAGQIPRLIEFLVPKEVDIPTIGGVEARVFEGQGHRVGHVGQRERV
jgi:hypothetical protein